MKVCHIRTRENVTHICAVLGWNHIFTVQLSNIVWRPVSFHTYLNTQLPPN